MTMNNEALKDWLRHELQQLQTDHLTVEIHNNFEPGSSAQVFNDTVKGRFTSPRLNSQKHDNKQKQKDKKKLKKRWKKIVRKML